MSRSWKSTAPYPKGATFGELLDWHLWWGTRPRCSKTVKNLRWPFVDFAHLVHLGVPATGNSETPATNLRYWRNGQHLPKKDTIVRNLFEELFGDDPELADWKNELWQALEQEREAKARRAARPSEAVRITTEADPQASARFGARNDAIQELGLRRDLLESLASRFGHTSMDEPDNALIQFLKRCASEYHTFRNDADEAASWDDRLEESQSEFDRLVAKGERKEADQLLDVVQRAHELRFISQIAEQVKMRQMRACAAMEGNDFEQAFKHFEKIAEMYRPYHSELKESVRVTFAIALADAGESERTQELAIKLLELIAGVYQLSNSWGMDTFLELGERKISRLITTATFFEHPKIMDFLTKRV